MKKYVFVVVGVFLIGGLIGVGLFFYSKQAQVKKMEEGEVKLQESLSEASAWSRDMVTMYPFDDDTSTGVMLTNVNPNRVIIIGKLTKLNKDPLEDEGSIIIETSSGVLETLLDTGTMYTETTGDSSGTQYNAIRYGDLEIDDQVSVTAINIAGQITALEVQRLDVDL